MSSLGQRIAELRKSKSFSQEDLANILNVSRQSVYKWESDQSIPELEKLVALGSVFEVSLDWLINGVMPENTDSSKPLRQSTGKTIIGIILIILGIIISVSMLVLNSFNLLGLIYGIPFTAMGLICVYIKENTGFWCTWVIFLSFYLYMTWAAGIYPSTILRTLSWTWEMNYARLALAWVVFIFMVIMILWSAKKFNPGIVQRNRKNIMITTATVIVLVGLSFLNIYKIMVGIIGEQELACSNSYMFLYSLLREIQALLQISLCIFSICMIRGMIKKR